MLTWPRWANYALLACVAFVTLNLGIAASGARSEAARLTAANDSLRRVTARVDSVYVRDTLTLWRVKRATDTLTATVEVWKRDTLRVVEYVTRADSTIRACSAALLTCEQRVAVRDARLAVLDSLNRNTAQRLRTAQRGRVRQAVCTVAGAGVGAELGAALRQPASAALAATAGGVAGLVLCR